MTRALLHITAVVGWLAVTAFAAPEKFEVASVRISPPGGTGQTSWSPMGGGTFAATNISLEINLTYAPEGSTDSSRPSIFTAVQEQLGLKLESQKVPLEMLVIDHCERTPTDN